MHTYSHINTKALEVLPQSGHTTRCGELTYIPSCINGLGKQPTLHVNWGVNSNCPSVSHIAGEGPGEILVPHTFICERFVPLIHIHTRTRTHTQTHSTHMHQQ